MAFIFQIGYDPNNLMLDSFTSLIEEVLDGMKVWNKGDHSINIQLCLKPKLFSLNYMNQLYALCSYPNIS